MHRLFICFPMLLLAVGCNGKPTPAASLEDGRTWKLASLTHKGLEVAIPAEANPTVSFANGRIHASSGCNSLSAEYTLRKGTLVLQDGGVTEIACPYFEFEDRYFPVIGSATRCVVDGESLTLSDGAVRPSV